MSERERKEGAEREWEREWQRKRKRQRGRKRKTAKKWEKGRNDSERADLRTSHSSPPPKDSARHKCDHVTYRSYNKKPQFRFTQKSNEQNNWILKLLAVESFNRATENFQTFRFHPTKYWNISLKTYDLQLTRPWGFLTLINISTGGFFFLRLVGAQVRASSVCSRLARGSCNGYYMRVV